MYRPLISFSQDKNRRDEIKDGDKFQMFYV